VKPLFNYDFGKRVILDTNALLNATFNSDGLAAHTLWVLFKKGTPIYVTPTIEAEVGRVSDRLRRKYRLAYDPAEAVRSSVRAHGILFAPAPAGPLLGHINKADEPIARAAKQLGAAIITDDIEFIVQARASAVDAWQYWEVSRSFTGGGELPGLSKTVRYSPPADTGGYIFARVVPGGWAGLRINQQFSVCEIEDGLWLYYDGLSEQWHVRTPGGDIARLAMPLKPDIQYVVGANFGPAGKGGLIVLLAAEMGSEVATARADVGVVGKTTAKSRLNVGHSQRQLDHWNGLIKDLVVAPQRLPPRTFRLLASTEDLSPNPADSDKLEEAVQRVIVLAS
jgi:predicted nucleic acid-binding protein